MPRQTDVDLAGLIGSRICHDLISPVGAIRNGLELMEMAGGGGQPEMTLIGDSAESATARIKFFRIAFGAAGDEALGEREVSGILRDAGRSMRQVVDWQASGAHPRREIRLAFLAVQCCESAMAHGGTIKISERGGEWSVDAEATRLSTDPALWSDLCGGREGAPISAAKVQFALLPRLMAEAGRQMSVTLSDTTIAFRF